jgi:hypothetical protein
MVPAAMSSPAPSADEPTPSLDLTHAPLGIDDHSAHLVPFDTVAAVVSALPAEIYTGAQLEHHLADIDWIKPRAIAHDRVVTWISDHVPVIPLPMWTLFSDEAHLVGTLSQQSVPLQEQLDKVRTAREYTVRVFANSETLSRSLGELSPQLAELEQNVTTASPGQAYLLRRKLTDVRKYEVRAVVTRVADEIYQTLSAHATEAARDALPQQEGHNYATLNAAFLIDRTQYDAFRVALTALVERYQPSGFRFDFTGPWPAYHFIRAR